MDAATETVITKFLDCFCDDPLLRIDVEARLTAAEQADPLVSPEIVAQLNDFIQVFCDPATTNSGRAAIKWAAVSALRGFVHGEGV
jgi:hypothetical protein